MSVLIKGMKMPNKCEECPLFNGDLGGCGATNYFILRKWGKGKPDWCPLVEVSVVRCKDCRYNYANMIPNGKGCQQNVYVETADNWYCADGEREDEVESDIDENWYSDEYRTIGEDERDEVEE